MPKPRERQPSRIGKRAIRNREIWIATQAAADLAIMATFDEGGGNDYFKTVAQTDQRTFCMLLGKILPTQVTEASLELIAGAFNELAEATTLLSRR